MAHRRGGRRRAERDGCRKKNLEARARWEFGRGGGTARSVKFRLDRAAAKRRGGTSKRAEPDAPALLPENLLPWAIFRACLTQPVVSPAGGVLGLSHASLDFKFRVFGVAPERESEVFEKFEFLESIYVDEVNAGLAGRSEPVRENTRTRAARPRQSRK